MRILYVDIDSLRPDHLGCYGYPRRTSPNMDRVAAHGLRFDNYHTPDAPCLPSRSAMFTGLFGIHNGAVGHGGTAADVFIEGAGREFQSTLGRTSWMSVLRQTGMRTVTVSPFGERHSAWHWYAGFNEVYNTGKCGMERADEIEPVALDWIARNGASDGWFLHVNLWDPHTPYRTPALYGEPFANDPPPAWMTQEILDAQRASYGPMSAREPRGFDRAQVPPRMAEEIRNVADFKHWIDGYDTGVRYADDTVGRILNALDAEGVLDQTLIIISSDHGENLGELNIYGDHQTADHITSRVPLIIAGPGIRRGVDDGLHYNIDLPPTLAQMLAVPAPAIWDGRSFAPSLRDETKTGREFLVLSQMAWSCQRSVRVGPWLMIRSYDTGLKNFPPVMLFNVEQDPHETKDLAAEKPDVVADCVAHLDQWHAQMMAASLANVDPMETVLREGGPYHARGEAEKYCQRLRATGRGKHAMAIEVRLT